MARAALVVAMLLAAGGALAGCLGDPIDPDGALPPGHDEHHDDAPPTGEGLGAPDIVLEAHAGMADAELALHPSPLQVALGSIVEIRVENQGRAQHTFTIHQFGADTGVLNPGDSRSVKFRADEAGLFEVMCDVPGHYQSGMKATLEVAA